MWEIWWNFDQSELDWQTEVDYFIKSIVLFISKSVDGSFKVNIGDYEDRKAIVKEK